MKKEQMRRWLTQRLLNQLRLTIAAIGGMAAMGLIATLLEFGVFWAIIRIGFISSSALAVLVTLGILAAIQYFTLQRLPKQLPDTDHEADLNAGPVVIRVVPNMTAVWTYAFGSMDSNISWTEWLLGTLALPQRMWSAAWYTWNRMQALTSVRIEPCAAVIRLLHREGERVEIRTIEEKLGLDDLPAVMTQLSLIDGVVFLTRRTFGVSLANRLADDMVEWAKKDSPGDSADDL